MILMDEGAVCYVYELTGSDGIYLGVHGQSGHKDWWISDMALL